ncbi:hypothetical protein SHAL103562_18680 [Shewanella algae]
MSASSPATKRFKTKCLKTKDPKTQALQKALSKAMATARARHAVRPCIPLKTEKCCYFRP